MSGSISIDGNSIVVTGANVVGVSTTWLAMATQFAWRNGTPPGPPTNTSVPSLFWNDATQTLNIWSPSQANWYNIALTSGTG